MNESKVASAGQPGACMVPILQTHSCSGGIPRASAQNYGRPHKALAQSKHGVTCATFCWPNNHISKLAHVYPQGEEVDAIL